MNLQKIYDLQHFADHEQDLRLTYEWIGRFIKLKVKWRKVNQVG